jgi:uncharacterized protein (UPF0333 family)
MRNLLLGKKKGQVGGLAPAILALVFAGIVLVFGIVMAQSLTDTRTGSTTGTVSTNVTLTLTAGGQTNKISQATACGYESWTPTAVLNWSNNVTLAPTTNYIVNANGTLFNVTHATKYNVIYTYKWGGEACDAGNLTVVGLGTFADFWEIIVLAIVITIVIGLLLVIFGGQQRR